MKNNDFEWDDAKAASNLRDHKVSFEMAAKVFADVFAVERTDLRENYREDRYTITGIAEGRLLVVAFTFRGNRIRIISARHAEPFERRVYHERNAKD
jgi:uncharacterized DUF497 family protein